MSSTEGRTVRSSLLLENLRDKNPPTSPTTLENPLKMNQTIQPTRKIVQLRGDPFPRAAAATTYDPSFESLKAHHTAQIDPMKVKSSLIKEIILTE